jgi:predicted ATPase
MFDEPEMSLHPQWIQLVVSLLRQTSARTTVLVATQSSDFIRWLEPSELVIADLGEQGTTFAWADAHRNLDEWLRDFTLSELWTMGELGGRR